MVATWCFALLLFVTVVSMSKIVHHSKIKKNGGVFCINNERMKHCTCFKIALNLLVIIMGIMNKLII